MLGHMRNGSGSSPGGSGSGSGFAMSSTPPQTHPQGMARWIPRSKTPGPAPTHSRARSGTGSSTTSSGFFASLQKGISGKEDKGSRERESREREKERGTMTDNEGSAPGRQHRSISTSYGLAGSLSMSNGNMNGSGTVSRPGNGYKEREKDRDGERDRDRSGSNSPDDAYKARIHQETIQRFRTLKQEAEAQYLAKLRELTSSRNGFRESHKADEKASKLRREHELAMAKLQQAMEEEEAVRLKEEKRRRKLGRSNGQVHRIAAASAPAAVDDEEDWLWRPDEKDAEFVLVESEFGHVRRGSREEIAVNKELIRREQQAIWDAARKRSNSGASPPKSQSNPNPPSQSQSQQALEMRKVRWATNSPVIGRPMSPAVPVPTPAPAPTMHERWLPSVQDYATDMREQARHQLHHHHQRSAPRPIPTRSSSGMGFHSQAMVHATGSAQVQEAGTPDSGGSFGSWRDWRASTLFPSGNGSVGGKDDANANNASERQGNLASRLVMNGGRRAFTPAPTSSASAAAVRHAANNAPPVPALPTATNPRKRTLSFTPAVPPTTTSHPVAPASIIRTSTPIQRSATPVTSSNAPSKISQIVDDRDPDTEAIHVSFDTSANASNTGSTGSTGSRWKGKGKAAPLAPMDIRPGGASCIGIYQPIVEDVCARVKRELAIAT